MPTANATNPHGEFIWYELMTTDPDAAADFYGDVVGWDRKSFDPSDPSGYSIFSAGGGEAAGLMKLPEGNDCEAGQAPSWVGYIGVEDVDATLKLLLADGASELVPASDIPGVGRFAVIADPQGAVVTIMRGASNEASRAYQPNMKGRCWWNELSTSDPAGALSFYGRHFGWTKGDMMPMGAMGQYQILKGHDGDMGAVMPMMPQTPSPVWTFYFGVDDIDAAAAKVTEKGGKVLHGPVEVPGGNFIIAGEDPQGAAFALTGPRRQD